MLKREVENREQVQKLLEEKNKELAKQQEEIKKNHEANLRKQKEEFDIQYRREMAALEENMKKDSEEKARLLEEGFKEKAAMMQETRPVRSIETIPSFDQWSLTIENH